MSRSNPTTRTPNPAKRFFEWDGENGTVRYYDRDEKKNIDVGDNITFIVLDELATIGGWHEDSGSAIYANEIRDTRDEPFIVKAFKSKQAIAEGFYSAIKDRVAASGGQFVANIYIAFKDEGTLTLGAIQFKGAALNAWVEFRKSNRDEVYSKAVTIKGSDTGKKGKIVFKTPRFHISKIDEKTDAQAKEIDKELQTYLKGYFKKTRVEQSEPDRHLEHGLQEPLPEDRTGAESADEDDSGIPF